MGAILGERPLREIGIVARNMTKSLDLAARALASGETLPDAAARLMLKPMVPRFLFGFVAERDVRKQAKANGVLERYRERPYAGGGGAGDRRGFELRDLRPGWASHPPTSAVHAHR